MWQKAFGDLGLRVSLRNQEWKVFIATRQQGDYDVARDGWIADYNDPFSFLSLLEKKNASNNSHYENPKYDAVLSQARGEINPPRRQQLYEEAWNLAAAEDPVMPVFDYVTTHLIKPYVGGGMGKNPLDRMYSRNHYIIQHQ
jgi:oligopeptide transport system substrate-binding protein